MGKIFSLALLITVAMSSCHSAEQGNKEADKDSTLVKIQVSVSDTLAAKMNVILNTYYQLKDAFVATDSVAADSAAKMLLINIQPISLKELESETKRYNKGRSSLESLQGEINGLLGETDILEKRKEFQMISDIMYDLISTVGVKGQVVYRDFCPMFNNDKGAYWLSPNKRINNPYYGDEMLGCGEIKETLQF